MNEQETFDKVVEHLRKQNELSQRNGTCLYRGPNGLKCAAGCLIPDELYEARMEGKIVSASILNKVFKDYNIDLIGSLQKCHDYTEIEDWEGKFKAIANLYDLVYKEPVSV